MTFLWHCIRKLLVVTGTGRKLLVHLLNKLRFQLETKAAVTKYKSLIILVFLHCSILSTFDNKSRAERLKYIDPGATRIFNIHVDQSHLISLPSIASNKKKSACLFVCKWIDGKLCENFAEYFSLLSHKKRTRKTQSVWIYDVLELNSRKDLFISQVLSSIMSYL